MWISRQLTTFLIIELTLTKTTLNLKQRHRANEYRTYRVPVLSSSQNIKAIVLIINNTD